MRTTQRVFPIPGQGWRVPLVLGCLGVVLLVSGLLLLPISSAFALSALPATVQGAQVECSGTSCNGVNPYIAGCAGSTASYWVVDSVPIAGAGGDAWIQLWYSGTCGTNWARYTCSARCQPVTVSLWVCNGARQPVSIVQSVPASATAQTKQEYLPTTLASAVVQVSGGGSTRTGCY